MSKFRTHLLGTVAGVAIAGTASLAAAGPNFTIDPSFSGTILPNPPAISVTDIEGFTSDIITNTSGSSYTGSGWVQFTNFLNPAFVLPSVSGLESTYGLYIKFTQTFTATSGGPGFAAPLNATVNTFTYSLYEDPGLSDTYVYSVGCYTTPGNVFVSQGQCNVSELGLGDHNQLQTPGVNDLGTADVLLATGGLVVSGNAGFNTAGGPFENVNVTFALTAAGSKYFTQPVPFYNLVLGEFNTTGTNVVKSGNQAGISTDAGSVDFGIVPEPGTLALVGSGLLGMVFALRRRNKRLS